MFLGTSPLIFSFFSMLKCSKIRFALTMGDIANYSLVSAIKLSTDSRFWNQPSIIFYFAPLPKILANYQLLTTYHGTRNLQQSKVVYLLLTYLINRIRLFEKRTNSMTFPTELTAF